MKINKEGLITTGSEKRTVDVNVRQDVTDPWAAFDSLREQPVKEEQPTKIQPEDALDILEVSAQAEDPEATVSTLMKGIEQNGESPVALRDMAERAESMVVESELKIQLEAQVATSALTTNQKVLATKFVQENTAAGNLLFTDILAAQHVRRMNDANKKLRTWLMTQVFPAERDEAIQRAKENNFPKHMEPDTIGVMGNTEHEYTKFELDQWRQGLRDRYLTDIFWLPHLLNIGGKQGDLDAWAALQQDRAAKSPMYAKGQSSPFGLIAGLIGDPFAGPITTGGLIVAKTAIKAIKTSVVASKLANKLGTGRLVSMLSRSGDSLVSLLRNDEQMMNMLLKETRQGTDPASVKLFDAAETAALENAQSTTNIVLQRTYRSPMANVATNAVLVGDNAAQDAVQEAVILATAKPTAGIKQTQDMLLKAIDAGDAIPMTLLPDVPRSGIPTPLTGYGTSMNNAQELATSAADNILYDIVSKKQRGVLAVDTLRVGPAVEDSLQRAANFGISGKIFSGISKMRSVLPGSKKFKGAARTALIDNVTKNEHMENALRKGLSQQLNIIYRGLSKRDTSTLNYLIRAADDARDFGTVTANGFLRIGPYTFKTVTPQIIDAFRARQLVMKASHRYLNLSTVQQASAKGWKVFGDEIAVPVKSHEVVKGATVLDEAGNLIDDFADRRLFEVSDAATANKVHYRAIKKEDVKDLLKDIPKNKNIIGDIDGYMHIQYQDKYRVFKVLQDKSGRVIDTSPIATADSWVETQEFIARQMKRPQKDGLSYVGMRSSDGTNDFVYNSDWMKIFRKMDDTQMDDLLAGLKQSGVLDDTVIADLLAIREKFGYKRASALMTRAKKRLSSTKGGTAPIYIGKEADTLYLDWMSKYLAKGEYVQKLEKSFSKHYRSLSPALKSDPYAQLSRQTALGREAVAYQNQLRTISGRIRSQNLVAADAMATSAANKLIRVKNKTISKIMDRISTGMPKPSQLLSTQGSIVTHAALGMLNSMQLGLQFSAALLNVLGTSMGRLVFSGNRAATFKAIIQAQADFAGYLALKVPIINKIGLGKNRMSKSILHTYDYIERSGVAAGVDFDNMGRMLVNVRGMRGWAGFVSRQVRKGVDAAAYPFKEGERLGQVYALLASRRLIAAEGKLKAGTRAFDEAVVERGKVLALNMMRHNSSGMTQNELMGVIMKFKEFGVQQGALFSPLGRQGLTKGELAGLYATWLGLFGPKGIPFSWDALTAAEMFAGKDDPDGGAGRYTVELMHEIAGDAAKQAKSMGLDVEAKTIQHWLEGGLPTAISDGNVRIASRFAVADFFSNYLTAVSMDEAMLGAVYTKTKRFLFSDAPQTYHGLMSMVQDGSFDLETGANAIKPLINQVTGVSNMIAAMQLSRSEDGVLRDKQGRALIVQPTLAEKLQKAMGVTPGQLVRDYDLQSILMRQKKSVRKYIRDNSERIGKLSLISPEYAEQSLNILMAELKEEGYIKLYPAIVSRIHGARVMLDKTIGLEARLLLRAQAEVMATGHENSVFKELTKQ